MSDGGIAFDANCSPLIINNTIAYNSSPVGGGIGCYGSSPILVNTVLYGNSAEQGNQVNLQTEDSDPIFLYCDIEGGREQFGGPGAGDNYTGRFEYNISSNPCFVDTTKDNFHLSDLSPCIGAGSDSIKIDTKWYYAPAYDFEGNPRPNPIGSSPDIGAFESEQTSVEGNLMGSYVPKAYTLEQNYPNPFNPQTTIRYELPTRSRIRLLIYDVPGQVVADLVTIEQSAGWNQVVWNANVSSGLYFYRIEAVSKENPSRRFVETKKMIMLK
jgi:hypothetical protein